MRAISCHIILTSLRSKADGSLGLSLSTPELTPEEKVAWFHLQGKNCKILLEPDEGAGEPPIEVKTPLDMKSPSQMMRSLLFLIWKESGSVGDFSSYYASRMDRACQKLRDELDSMKS